MYQIPYAALSLLGAIIIGFTAFAALDVDDVGRQPHRVHLNRTGEEPRHVLALEPDQGSEQHISMKIVSRWASSEGDFLHPPAEHTLRVTVLARVRAATENGNIIGEVTIEHFEREHPEWHTTLPQWDDKIDDLLRGASGKLIVSPHGHFAEPLRLDREIESPVEQAGFEEIAMEIAEVLRLLVLPMPREPVGIDAAWSSQGAVPIMNDRATGHQMLTCRVDEIDGKRARIRVGFMQHADPQDVPSLLLEAFGEEVGDDLGIPRTLERLEEFRRESRGLITHDRRSVFAAEAALTIRTSTRVDASTGEHTSTRRQQRVTTVTTAMPE